MITAVFLYGKSRISGFCLSKYRNYLIKCRESVILLTIEKGKTVMKVLNFGSLNYDYVYKVDRMILAGKTMDSYAMETHFGGSMNLSILDTLFV